MAIERHKSELAMTEVLFWIICWSGLQAFGILSISFFIVVVVVNPKLHMSY